jgi:hypothetical protein
MLKIDRLVIDTLGRTRSADDVVGLVHEAVRLEFGTIPPYLTAMLSLRPGTNRDIWWAIHDVVVDEMLHMLIGCNLLNALGTRPALDDPDLVLDYPGELPLGVGSGLQVGLERFSLDLVERVFMEIEEPEQVLPFPGRAGLVAADRSFGTIGEFYRTLAQVLTELGDQAFRGDPGRQVVAPRWFPADRLFPIRDARTAVRALTLVTEEGEGTATSPIDPDGDIAHYYRFAGIRRGRRLVVDPDVAQGFSFSGEPYHFDEAGVWPLTPNQRHGDLDADSEAWFAVRRFRLVFTRLLDALARTVDGDPDHLDAAMGVMFELKLAGQVLVTLPVRRTGVDTGPHAGPVFARLDAGGAEPQNRNAERPVP